MLPWHEPVNCSRFILLQYDDKFRFNKLLELIFFYFLLAMVNDIDIVNMSNIYDKGRKYDNCGTCKMENTENL